MSNSEPLQVGVISLARPTFDVPFAEQVCANAWKLLEQIPINWIGSPELLFDAESVESQIAKLKKKPIDLLLIMQLTFTDATMTVKLAESFDVPLFFWSFPEKRTGGRLRLNSLCGVNLAAHALGKSGIQCDYINFSPDDPETSDALSCWIRAFQTRKKLSQTKIAVIGKHPDGFHTCAFDSEKLNEISAIKVEQMELEDLFDEAERIEQKTVNLVRNELDSKIDGI